MVWHKGYTSEWVGGLLAKSMLEVAAGVVKLVERGGYDEQ